MLHYFTTFHNSLLYTANILILKETGDANQVVVTGKLSAQRSEAPISLEVSFCSYCVENLG